MRRTNCDLLSPPNGKPRDLALNCNSVRSISIFALSHSLGCRLIGLLTLAAVFGRVIDFLFFGAATFRGPDDRRPWPVDFFLGGMLLAKTIYLRKNLMNTKQKMR